MATGDDTKLPLTSRDVHAERLAHFRALFPEAFTEGKTDLKKLAQLLGEAVTDAPERYGLSWSGKSEAIRAIQITSPGTLRPCVEESCPPLPFTAGLEGLTAENAKNTEIKTGDETTLDSLRSLRSLRQNNSENLIIEGDNLETLKLLQGGYHGRVKMIYIDPPYNTGGEFIYPDNYKEGLADYLRFSGQVSGEGIRLTTNAETDGRYHSKWLTMMYPRLFLARNLLREDGVIFVSIDDHEVHNLRAVMNEIFGEENFVGQAIWQKKYSPQNDAKHLSELHEYVIAYAKSAQTWRPNLLKRSEAGIARYKNPDNDPRGPWKIGDLTSQTKAAGHSYPIVSPTGKTHVPTSGRQWAAAKGTFDKLFADNRIWFGQGGNNVPSLKQFLSEVQDGTVPTTLWLRQLVGDNQEAANEIADLNVPFDSPKPVRLLQHILKITSLPTGDDLILDFFAGSGTTAQAVLELNAQDGGNRQFILVQLPEPTERKDFPTIADITKERVRRVIKKLETEIAAKELKERKDSEGQLELGSAPAPGAVSRALAGNIGASERQHASDISTRSELPTRASATAAGAAAVPDFGFKVFKLGSSNFKVWDAATAPTDGAGLAEQLKLIAHNVEDGRPDDALLYELILKSNLPLTSRVVAGQIGAQTFYDVADGTLAICLERPITQETLRGLVARKPKGVICLDIAFVGNDQLKANTVLEMKSHGIEFHTA